MLCKTPARNHKVIKKGPFLGISLFVAGHAVANCTSTVPDTVKVVQKRNGDFVSEIAWPGYE